MSNIPENWADLSEQEKAALLEMARGHLFWKSAFARFKWLGGVAQVLMAIAAAWILFKDGFAVWLQGLVK
jgi:hypothetical protein